MCDQVAIKIWRFTTYARYKSGQRVWLFEERQSGHSELWDNKMSEIIIDVDLETCSICVVRYFLFIPFQVEGRTNHFF